MQIKTSMRYHLTLSRMSPMKWTENNILGRMEKIKKPRALVVGMYNSEAIMENSIEFPQEIKKNRITYHPVISLLDIC